MYALVHSFEVAKNGSVLVINRHEEEFKNFSVEQVPICVYSTLIPLQEPQTGLEMGGGSSELLNRKR